MSEGRGVKEMSLVKRSLDDISSHDIVMRARAISEGRVHASAAIFPI